MILLIVVIKNILHCLQVFIILGVIDNRLTHEVTGGGIRDVFCHIIDQTVVRSCAVLLVFSKDSMIANIVIMQHSVFYIRAVLIDDLTDIFFCQAFNGSPVHINNRHDRYLLQS